MADSIAKDMVGLPMGLLIAQPIIEVAKGQSELCRTYLDTLLRLAFTSGNKAGDDNTDTKKGNKSNDSKKPAVQKTRTIEFHLQRPVVDEKTGNVNMVDCKVQAPLLALVPLPAFTMDEATVRFSMEVKSQELEKSTSSAETSTGISGSFWGFKAQISGKVSTNREHTRSTDKSAKYEIFARAVQHEPPEGMAKLSAIFASVIEPMALSTSTASNNTHSKEKPSQGEDDK